MIDFEYLRPSSIEEAMELLRRHSEQAMLIAGGTDVMVGIRQRKFSPQILVSLKGIKGFDQIGPYEDGMRIGALATHRQIGESDLVRERFSALADAVNRIGSLQIRNVATMGGNIANGLPSADTACPLLVFDTQLRLKGSGGERNLPLREFYLGPGKTILEHDEMLLEFIIPPLPSDSASAYWKHGRRQAMEIAMLGVAMMLAVEVADASTLSDAFTRNAPLDELFDCLDRSEIYCREARIALGVAAPTPMRAKSAEEFLKGKRLTTRSLLETGLTAAKEARLRDSMRGTAWYRRKMVEVSPRRLALRCLERILFSRKEGS
jgi:CO/xanthine dehydrogenase FAD-binding subunit